MLRRLGVMFALACALALAVGVAGAATAKRATFSVTLTATLTKDWNLRTTADGDCGAITRYTGQWRLDLSSRRASRVTATAPRRGRPVRFSGGGVRSLAGSARQTGAVRTEPRAGCGGSPVQRNCSPQTRAVRNARAGFSSPRAGILRFGRLRGASGIRSLAGSCGNELDDVRALATDLSLADGPLATADVFARTVPQFFVSGNTEQVTTIEGEVEGTVTERVRWTLTFRRLR